MYFKEFVSDEEKEFYLKFHYLRNPLPDMLDIMICLYCNKKFTVKDFKVLVTKCDCCNEYLEIIVCPYAPDCEGDFTNWAGKEILN